MADPVKPPEGQSGTQGQDGEAAKPVIDAARIEKLETQLLDMSTKFTKLNNFLAAEKRVAAKADAPPTEEQTVTLKSLKTELDNRDKKIREKAIRTEIRTFAKDNDISAEKLPFFEAYVEKLHMEKLKTNANDEVVFEDELGEEQPFAILGKKILSGGGQSFLQPVSTPGAVGQRTNQGVGKNSPLNKPLNQWTAEERKKNPQAMFETLRQGLIASRQGPQS